jgi:uncharacterized membrane protein
MTKKHLLLMLACCLVPLTGLTVIYAFGVPANSVIYFGMILVCPLMHLVLMRGMMRHNRHHTEPEHDEHPLTARNARLVVNEIEETV